MPLDGPQQCIELMTGVVYPYSSSYIQCLELAIDDSILQNDLAAAIDFALILLPICRRFAKESPACVGLVLRLSRLYEELGNMQQSEKLLNEAQVIAYSDSALLSRVLGHTKKFNITSKYLAQSSANNINSK